MTEPIPFDPRRKPKTCGLDVEHVGPTERISANQAKTNARCRNCKIGKIGFDPNAVYSRVMPGVIYPQYELNRRGRESIYERQRICEEDQRLQRFEE